tara:strand:- start:535 stop:822 length:288 start_codon:yes stop_codon:yes gene_type:complete
MKLELRQKNLYYIQVYNENRDLLNIVKSYDTPIIFINWTKDLFFLSSQAKGSTQTTSRHTNIFLNGQFDREKDKFITLPHDEFMNLIEKEGVKLE